VDAATALIEDEPPPRDRLELQRFAATRLGKDVLDVEDVDLTRGDRTLLHRATWRLGPGDRVGLVGVNGSGKTSLLRVLAGELHPDAGRVRRGRTVALAHLSQDASVEDPELRVLAAVEEVKRVARTTTGEVGATSLLEGFGFTGDRLTARVGDLSGGERRRLQLLRLLLTEPNVLLLDEPTNDLDIDTLTVVEDYLDQWPGTLVVVSHDRYFLERTCDTVWALVGDGSVRMLPRGVEEYLELRRSAEEAGPAVPRAGGRTGGDAEQTAPAAKAGQVAKPGSAEAREARKTMARVERQLSRLQEREAALHAELLVHASDHEKLGALDRQLREVTAERESLEEEWLEAGALLE
jgi:ATP-binding cassette subfamily F protein uup